MEKSNNSKDYSKFEENLEAEVTGYNNRKYSLYELSLSANDYTINAPEYFRNKIIEKYSQVYNCTEEKVPASILKEVYGLDEKFVEEWKKLDNWFYDFYKIERIGFEVSNLGRIRYDDIYLMQEAEKYGYLTISKELNKKKYPDLKVKTFSKYVYYYISAGFYGKPNGKCIHHINNNGYDCRPENLILLTPPQHSKVHGSPVKGDNNSYEKVSQVGQ